MTFHYFSALDSYRERLRQKRMVFTFWPK